jgi:hypothetical protein
MFGRLCRMSDTEQADASSFWHFLWAVKGHWVTLMSGGAAIVALALIERFTGQNIPTWLYVTVLIAFAFWACYLAWRDSQRKQASVSDSSTRRRDMLINRLEQLIKESPPVTPPWHAVHGAVEGLAEVGRITAHRNQVLAFLEVHWPEAVKRFERQGTRGLEELLAECLKEDDKTRPNIKGEIEEVHDIWALPQTRQAEEKPDEPFEYFFTIKVRVGNIHPVETTLRFELWLQAPHAKCKAIKSSLARLFHRYEQHATGTLSRMSMMQLVTDEMPDLEALCRTPLTRGVERVGWLRFVLAKADNPIRQDVESMTLIAKDVYGGEHPILSHRSEWKHSGEIVTQFVLDLEEQKLRDLRGTNLL